MVPDIRAIALTLLAMLITLSARLANASDVEAASSPLAVIETRQAGFKKMGAAMKAIVEQLKSATPDQSKMAAATQVISSFSTEPLHWFPAGTGTEAGVDTDALPNIWTDRAKFDSLATRLVAESKTLTTTMSGTDLTAIKTQVKALSEVCSTCHKSFRSD